MAVHLEITDRAGFRTVTVEQDGFWIGCRKSNAEVELDLPGCAGRVLEVKLEPDGGLRVRTEAGIPFPVRSVSGNVGRRFESVLDGDVLNVGAALVKVSVVRSADTVQARELDPGALTGTDAAGAPVGGWYETFMEVADVLEGIADPVRMIATAFEAVLTATGADRVYLELDRAHAVDGKHEFWRTHVGERPFHASRSLVDQARESGRVVHVPVAEHDPVASQLVSVRQEGISSSIAIPLQALGKALGVLYADCVRDGAVLTATDLQRVVFLGRMLAGALGNRALVASLVRAPAESATTHPALQTSSPSCEPMVERVKLYAPTDYTVLLRGETGTGKEVIAGAIHELSRRKDGPFVPVNCAAIPEQLMESMLFGHERGAFTGAMQTRRGHFDEAHGGTLFLDEVGDMALELQAKILRVLQDRIVTPVGSQRAHKVDVRVLAATHQDLEAMVRAGRFREDLYYRLRELEIVLAPLRERREDILMLTNRFLQECAAELGFATRSELTTETLDYLQRCRWRGNIRELRHVIKGAALRAAGGPIQLKHLDVSLTAQRPETGSESDVAGGARWKERLEAQERAALRETLEQADGNLTKGAELFGVPRTTYREKLVKAGLLKGKEADE